MNRALTLLAVLIGAGPALLGEAQTTEEALAERLFQQAKNFARQGNFREALGDYQRVVDTYPKSSVADNALLELAKYYLDVANDASRASTFAEQIKTSYLTSESAPEAFIIAGRIALGRSHQPADLDIALAQFDRVAGLFPDAPAVPTALVYAGETKRLARRWPEALERFQRVTTDYDTSAAAAGAHLGTGMVLAAQGDATGAMEEFQRVRNQWPDSPEAATALARATILFRLYVRAKNGGPFTLSPESIGPLKADNVRALVTTRRGTVYFATDTAVASLTEGGDRPPVATRPRGLTLDGNGNLVVIEGNALRPQVGSPIALTVPQPGKPPRPLNKIDAAVVTSTGDWLVADDEEKAINRFDATGRHLGSWAAGHLSRMAINEFDEVAGIERDSKNIVMFDAAGKVMGKIAPRTTGYEFVNPEDLAFDVFNHLYVLDRTSVIVLDVKKLLRPGTNVAARSAPASAPQSGSPLVATFAEPERNPGAIRRATAFAFDAMGRMYIADDRLQKIQLYR